MRLTKTMLKQLAYAATIQGGASTAGCGNGDFNRYMRLIDMGYLAWSVTRPTAVIVTDKGRKALC